MISDRRLNLAARLIACLGITALLAACGSPSNVDAPAELKPFKKLYKVQVDWSKKVGSLANSSGRMRPAAFNGSVIVASDSGTVTSLDAITGKQNWTVDLARPISSGIAVGDSLLSVATRDGDIVVMSAENGSIRWSVNVLGEVLSLPAIGNGKIFVQTVDGRVLALSEANGSTDWTYERTVPPLSLHGNSGTVFMQGLLVTGFASGNIVGIDSRNGREIWDRVVSYPSGRSDVERLADVDAPPVISGALLFAASYQGKLLAMDLRNGRILWTRPMSTYLPFAADDRHLYIVNDEGVIVTIDQQTGADVWIQNDLKGRISTRPVLDSGTVIVGDKEGFIHVLNARNGKVAGRNSVDGSRVVGHLVYKGHIYSITEHGEVIAYSIQVI